MHRQTLSLGRCFDIRVGVHVSWLAVFALLTYGLSHALVMLPQREAFGVGALCALMLFVSVVAHEFAHAFAARAFGVRTDAITLFLFGGVATLEEEPRTPRADALVALAGPAASAVLAGVAFGALRLGAPYLHGHVADAAAMVLGYIAVANSVLAAFNLLPAYPMDGGRVLRALIWRAGGDRDAATLVASRVGALFGVLFVVGGCAAAAAERQPLFVWYAMLGAFLVRQGLAETRLLGEPLVTAP